MTRLRRVSVPVNSPGIRKDETSLSALLLDLWDMFCAFCWDWYYVEFQRKTAPGCGFVHVRMWSGSSVNVRMSECGPAVKWRLVPGCRSPSASRCWDRSAPQQLSLCAGGNRSTQSGATRLQSISLLFSSWASWSLTLQLNARGYDARVGFKRNCHFKALKNSHSNYGRKDSKGLRCSGEEVAVRLLLKVS